MDTQQIIFFQIVVRFGAFDLVVGTDFNSDSGSNEFTTGRKAFDGRGFISEDGGRK
jgi:hypothetical protein